MGFLHFPGTRETSANRKASREERAELLITFLGGVTEKLESEIKELKF
jgi:hypothetical protein